MEASLANLKAFKEWKKLHSLALSGRGVRSLEGIAALESLEDLFLGRTGVQDLAPLAGLSRLRRLKLVSPLKEVDFSPIRRIDSLQTLVIQSGGRLESIDFIAGLRHLQELDLTGVLITDGRLDALFSLPALRRVRLMGDYGEQVERLRGKIRDCDIQATPQPPETAVQVIRSGEVEMRKLGEGFWSIFQDMTDLLGVENNFDADRKVRQAIRRQDVDLFKRLEFDPDADFISVRARGEADIRQAAGIIQSILIVRKQSNG